MIHKRLEGASILVVDDNPMNLGVLFDHLKTSGFKILIAEDGESAIHQAKFAKPDVILMDVMMPGIDGFEACRNLKKDEETKDIPVIFMTALFETADKIKGFEAGAVDYITKPFQNEEVIARITAHLTIQLQKKELQELNATKDKLLKELGELNATKDKFFSIIAHDLRSPFNGLIGASDLLIQSFEALEKEIVIDLIKSMNIASRNAFNLLNNLLEWSRSQTGRIEWDPNITDISIIIRENKLLLKHNAEEKGISVVSEIQDNTFVYADEHMINTIIRNLITNAMKYSRSGEEIRISSKDAGDFLEISVSDEGIGIKPENIGKLFRIDVHHTTKGTANEQGTGLGLILCKEFVEKHNGKIWVESELGKGATFRFTLPKSNGKTKFLEET